MEISIFTTHGKLELTQSEACRPGYVCERLAGVLQLQITRLLQESGHHWLEAMQQLGADSVLVITSRIQNLQQAAVACVFGTSGATAFFVQLCQKWIQPWDASPTEPQGEAAKK